MLTAGPACLDDTDSTKQEEKMAQMRGSAGYGIGQPNPFNGGPSSETPENNALDAIREQTSKIEDLLDAYSEPVKPYVFPQHLLPNTPPPGNTYQARRSKSNVPLPDTCPPSAVFSLS